MKVIFVCSNLGFGGAERVAVTLANGFLAKGHDVIVATNLYEKVNFTLDDGIIVENIVSTNGNRFKKWFSSVKDLRRLIRRNQPDIVIGIMELCSLIARISTIGTKIPVVSTDHYTFDRPKNAPFTKQQWFFKYIVNYIYKHITVLTEADKEIAEKKFRGVTVMPNPLSLQPVNEIPQKEKTVFAAGRIGGWYAKGFDILLQAWKSFPELKDNVNEDDNLRDWWLQIAGDGKKEDFDYLTSLIPDGEWVFNDNINDDDNDGHLNTKENDSSEEKQNSRKSSVLRSEKYHIEFLGFQKDMESLYKKSEIFVLSSRYEGFGLVLIEAMSQGCAPVVCDYKGRQREIIGDPPKSSLNMEDFQKTGIEICENGILCKPENVEELAKSIQKMITDEEYRKQVQQNAIGRSKFYDMEHTMNRWESYLANVITKN